MRFTSLTVLCLALSGSTHGHSSMTSIVSMARNNAVAGWEGLLKAVEAADIPEDAAIAMTKAKDFMADKLPGTAEEAAQWIKENPGTAALYGVAALSLVPAVAPGVIASPALTAAGFAGNGIAGSSLAAGVQANIGNVVAPSVFATLQSAGMGGYGVVAVNAAVQGGSGAVALGSGVAGWLKSKL